MVATVEGDPHGVAPVSYTHLDVYKRQLKNNEWTMARVLDTRMVPDSLGIRHIVLPYTEDKLADSLLTALRGGHWKG